MPSSSPNPVQRAPGFGESAVDALLKISTGYKYVFIVLLTAAIPAWLVLFGLKVTDIVSTYDRVHGLQVSVVEWPRDRIHHIAWAIGAVFGVIRQHRGSGMPAPAGSNAPAAPKSMGDGARGAVLRAVKSVKAPKAPGMRRPAGVALREASKTAFFGAFVGLFLGGYLGLSIAIIALSYTLSPWGTPAFMPLIYGSFDVPYGWLPFAVMGATAVSLTILGFVFELLGWIESEPLADSEVPSR